MDLRGGGVKQIIVADNLDTQARVGALFSVLSSAAPVTSMVISFYLLTSY